MRPSAWASSTGKAGKGWRAQALRKLVAVPRLDSLTEMLLWGTCGEGGVVPLLGGMELCL